MQWILRSDQQDWIISSLLNTTSSTSDITLQQSKWKDDSLTDYSGKECIKNKKIFLLYRTLFSFAAALP
jgi:hypothetical protein